MFGTLIEHGPAPYEFLDDGVESYFVTLKVRGVEKTLWSIGYSEAIAEANINIGDTVKFKFLRKEPVMLKNNKKGYRSFFEAEKIEKKQSVQADKVALSQPSKLLETKTNKSISKNVSESVSPYSRGSSDKWEVIFFLLLVFLWVTY